MVAVNRAYDTLSDQEKRSRYDQTGQDEPVRPPLDQQAVQVIMQLFNQLVEQLDENADHIQQLRNVLREGVRNAQKEAQGLKKKTEALQRRRKKLKFKGGDRDFLADYFDQQIRKVEAMAESVAQNVKLGERDAQPEGNRPNPLPASR